MRWRGLAGRAGLGGVRSLYLRIYLTVVAALLVFALLAAVLVGRHAEAERGRIDLAVSERTLALASLLENSLPPGRAAVEVQRQAVLDWSRRLRIPIALDGPDGQRIGVSPFYDRKVRPDRSDERTQAYRIPLADGRVLWVLRSAGPRLFGDRPRPDHVHDRGAPPGAEHGRRGPPQGDPPRGWRLEWPGFGHKPGWADDVSVLFMLLATLFVAVTLGVYPVVRRLTRRLEALQHGVEQFGAGDLGRRVDADGRDEVAAVAGSFNRAAQRVEDLVRANRALLANASHELRSPLARLKMALAMVDSASPTQREALQREIDRDIRELDSLVEEVLLASRLDAQQALRIESVDLLGLLVEEAARVGVSAEGETVLVQADERLLRRALRNLLENARRYGGGEVDASVRTGEDGRIEVQVCDRGPGVPPDCREQVFEPFFRLPGHAEHAGGVGLGLSLVRQIAVRHGGSVRCLDRAGGGSCFRITLPGEAVSARD